MGPHRLSQSVGAVLRYAGVKAGLRDAVTEAGPHPLGPAASCLNHSMWNYLLIPGNK